MAARKAVSLGLSAPDFTVFFGYVAMVCALVPWHEPWGDEAQSWLLARDLPLRSLLFHYLRYEGHPPLWYLLLWAPAHLGMSYAFINWFSVAFAIAGIYVLLRWAPFPVYLRALLPFTFFLAYQYAIVARSYVLFPLCIFLAAHFYRQRPARPIAFAVSLALLANVSIHGSLAAAGLACAYLWNLRSSQLLPPRRQLWAGAAIFAGALLFAAACIWPSVGSLPPQSPKITRILNAISLPAAPRAPSASPAVPTVPTAPPASPSAPAFAPVPPAHSPGFAARLHNARRVLWYSFTSVQPLAFLFHALVLVYLFQRRSAALALPIVLVWLFLSFAYAAEWHLGLLWVTVIASLWAAWDQPAPPILTLQNTIAVLLALQCLLQLPWTAAAFRYDALNPVSPAKAIAAYLQQLPPATRIAGFGHAIAAEPYFPHHLFFNNPNSFVTFEPDPRELTLQQTLALKPDVVVIEPAQLPQAAAAGYPEVYRQCASLFFPNKPVGLACLIVVRPAPGPGH